ncbi:MAG TPA: YcxB family protein [Gemmataceae bacterium]|nr:YcxB family protein [Gemmataceae bacterium]
MSVLFATLLILPGVALGFLMAFLVAVMNALSKKAKAVLGEQVLEITEKGLLVSREVNRSLYNWSTSFRIRETRNHVFIFVSTWNAHIIPLRRPPLEGSVREFLDELASRIRATR